VGSEMCIRDSNEEIKLLVQDSCPQLMESKQGLIAASIFVER